MAHQLGSTSGLFLLLLAVGMPALQTAGATLTMAAIWRLLAILHLLVLLLEKGWRHPDIYMLPGQ